MQRYAAIVSIAVLGICASTCAVLDGAYLNGVRARTDCSALEWTPTRKLISIEKSRFHDVSIAQYGGRVVVAASAGPHATSAERRRLLIMSDADSSYAWKHEGQYAFVAPRVAFDAQGLLHLFWGEAAQSDLQARIRALERGDVQRIMHAVHRPHGGWSQPQVAYQAQDKIYWSWDFAQISSVNGAVNVVAADVGPPEGVVRITTAGAKTRATYYASNAAGYISLTATPEGEELIAYMGLDTVAPSVGNSVFAMNLANRSAVRIQRSIEGAATMVNITATPALIATWGQNHDGGLFADGVRFAVSSDRGRTWSRPTTFIREEGGLSHLHIIGTDRCVTAVYLTNRAGVPAVRSWSFAGKHWEQIGEPRLLERARPGISTTAITNGIAVAAIADDSIGGSHILVFAGKH